MEYFVFGLALVVLTLIIAFFIYSKVMGHRLKKSKYGHTFDFSKMPKQKLNIKDVSKK